MSETARQIVVLLISLLVSILATVLPEWKTLGLTKGDEILLGVALFIVFLILDLVWLLNKSAVRQTENYRLWLLREPCDSVLSNIRHSFYEIAKGTYGATDLFLSHFMKRLRELDDQIGEVADKNSMRVQADHFLSVDNVLDAFRGDTERVWRYTWGLANDSKLFDSLPWKRYFEKTAYMLPAGEIKAIRCLLIIDQLTVLEGPRVKKLLDFFATNDGYECRLILKSDYDQICSDNCDALPYEDFGIYGNRLLFLTEKYEPVIIGVFTKDENKIAEYKKLFDTMWTSTSVSRPNPSRAISGVTLVELFSFDDGTP